MRKAAQIITLFFIFTIPWESAIKVEAIGTFTRFIGLCTAGVWVISVLVEGKLRKFHIYHIIVFFYMFYNVASIFWTSYYDLTMERVNTFIQLAIMTWILWDLVSTPKSFRDAMQVFVLGGYLAVGSAISNFITGQTISSTDVGRYTGAAQNAVEFAIILSLSLPMAWQLASSRENGSGSMLLRVLNFIYIPLALFTIILTASRTSLVTIIPGLLYIVGTMNRVKLINRIIIFVVFVAGVYIGQSLVPQVTLDRLGTIGASIQSNDIGGRVVLWNESFKVFLDHPLLGIGSGSLAAPEELGTFAHNTFLSILAELGIFGFILFLSIVIIVFLQILKQPKSYALFWLMVYAIWIISIFTLTWDYTKTTWFILNMIMISTSIYNLQGKQVNNITTAGVSDMNSRANLPQPAGNNV